MPGFSKGPNYRTPFGVNEFLRSTRDVKTKSAMIAASSVPSETVDDVQTKNLRPGTLICRITSGDDADLFGPHDPEADDGREDLDNLAGVCNTALPWQLNERNVEVALVYEATVYQARLINYDDGDVIIGISDVTANLILAGSADVADELAGVKLIFDPRDASLLP